MLPYHTAFDGTGRPVFTYYRERLLRRAAGFQWQGAVHECITPSGKIVYGDAAVEHHKEKQEDSGRNLRIYQSLLDKGMDQAVADAYKAGGGAPYLDYYNTIFGQVYEGMEVVDSIAIASDPDQDGKPRTEITLTSVQISSYGSPDPSPLPAADSAASDGAAGDSSAASAPAS